MLQALQLKAFAFVIPMLLGPLVFLLVLLLKRTSSWIDAQNPAIKRVLVVAVAILVTAGANLVGQGSAISCDTNATDAAQCLSQITPDVLKAILASGVAYFLHYLKKLPSR